MKPWIFRAVMVALLGIVLAGPARADEAPAAGEAADGPASPTSDDATVDSLDQRLKVLERKDEIDKEAREEAKKSEVKIGAGKDGFFIKSADGGYVFKLRGLVQFDGKFFNGDDEVPFTDVFEMRRVRPIIEGTVWKWFDFRLAPDFGTGRSQLIDAYVDTRFKAPVRIRVGKFKAPIGLERLQSDADTMFLEPSQVTNLVPVRDIGLMVWGEPWEGRLAYAIGVFNGVVDGGNADTDTNNGKDAAARIFVRPFTTSKTAALAGLGFGVSASTGTATGITGNTGLPVYRSPGLQTYFAYRSAAVADGTHSRLVPQLYWYWGRFGLMSEYGRSDQEVTLGADTESLSHHASQVSATFMLTDDAASYTTITPKRSIGAGQGGFGAVELAVRWSELVLDEATFPIYADPEVSANHATQRAVGVNWYLNRNIRIGVNYSQTSYEGGAVSGDREDEHLLQSRFQINF